MIGERMRIFQIFKVLEDGTPEILCGSTSKWRAEVILRSDYPEEYGKIVWLDVVRKEGKHSFVDGQVVK